MFKAKRESQAKFGRLSGPTLAVGFSILFLLLFGSVVLAQQNNQRVVTGTITDSSTGETLPGVNIIVDGTNTGTTSDIDGAFSLEVPGPEAVLIFSFVGYEREEVKIGNQNTLQVRLTPDLSDLEEFEVVGYGTMKKSSVTSAISKIENDKLDQIPAGRPETALVGRMAGVNISTNRSTPGAAPIIRDFTTDLKDNVEGPVQSLTQRGLKNTKNSLNSMSSASSV